MATIILASACTALLVMSTDLDVGLCHEFNICWRPLAIINTCAVLPAEQQASCHPVNTSEEGAL